MRRLNITTEKPKRKVSEITKRKRAFENFVNKLEFKTRAFTHSDPKRASLIAIVIEEGRYKELVITITDCERKVILHSKLKEQEDYLKSIERLNIMIHQLTMAQDYLQSNLDRFNAKHHE